MLDTKADRLGELSENDEKRFNAVLQRARFKTWTMRCRAKQESWQDQTRLRITVMNSQPINYAAECHRLVSRAGDMPGFFILSSWDRSGSDCWSLAPLLHFSLCFRSTSSRATPSNPSNLQLQGTPFFVSLSSCCDCSLPESTLWIFFTQIISYLSEI